MKISTVLIAITVGHLAGAYMFYFFHRYIFHGHLGKYPILRQWKAIHTKHHRNPKDPGSLFFPWWANIAIWSFTASLLFVVPYFSLGMLSFFCLYSYRHRVAHLGSNTRSAKHHMSHHHEHVLANFSGTYPFIDRLFGTYEHKLVPIKETSYDQRKLK